MTLLNEKSRIYKTFEYDCNYPQSKAKIQMETHTHTHTYTTPHILDIKTFKVKEWKCIKETVIKGKWE